MSLDERVMELAAKYRPLAVEILKEVIGLGDDVDHPHEGHLTQCSRPTFEVVHALLRRVWSGP